MNSIPFEPQMSRPRNPIPFPTPASQQPAAVPGARTSSVRLTLLYPNEAIDIARIQSLLSLLQGVGEPVILAFTATHERIASSIIASRQTSTTIETLIRGSCPSFDVEQSPLSQPTAELVYQGVLSKSAGDWAPTATTQEGKTLTPATASIAEAALPLFPGEALELRLAIRPVLAPRRQAAQEDLLVLPYDENNPFAKAAYQLAPEPNLPRFADKKLQQTMEHRLTLPACAARGTLLLVANSQKRIAGKSASLATVFAHRFDCGYGGFSLANWHWIGARQALQLSWEETETTLYLTIEELATIWQPITGIPLPGISYLKHHSVAPPPALLKESGIVLGTSHYRGEEIPIRLSDQSMRFGAFQILGASGYGKSVMAEQLIYRILERHPKTSVIVIDPHGTLVRNIALRSVPPGREDNVSLHLLGDKESISPLPIFPKPPHIDIDEFISTTMATIKALFVSNWSETRMESTIYNCVAALAYYNEATIFDIYRMLFEPHFRVKVLRGLADPIIVSFWTRFSQLSKGAREQIAQPIMSRIDKLFRSKPVRNMLMTKMINDPFQQVDHGGVLLFSLEGTSITDEADFLMELILTKCRLMMIERFSRTHNNQLLVCIDECQRAKGITLPSIIREGRKSGIMPILISQSFAQWSEDLAKTVVDNFGNMATFANRDDAAKLTHILSPFEKDELANLDRHTAVVKLSLSDNTTLPALSIATDMVNRPEDQEQFERILTRSRELYTRPRREVEADIERLLSGQDSQRRYQGVDYDLDEGDL